MVCWPAQEGGVHGVRLERRPQEFEAVFCARDEEEVGALSRLGALAGTGEGMGAGARPPQVVLEEDSWGGRDCWYPALCFACGEPGILSREAVQKANPGLDPSHDVSFEQLERALSSCSRFTLQRRPALHQDYLGLLQSRGSFVGIACVEPEGHARDAHYFGYDGYRRVLYYGDGATHAFGVDDDDVKTRRGAKAFFDAIDFKHFTAVRQVCTKAGKRHISPL